MSKVIITTDKIIDIFADILEIDSSLISLEKTFEELEIDSILFIRLVVQCETQLNIQFEDEMLLISKFPDVDTFIKYVQLRCEAKDQIE